MGTGSAGVLAAGYAIDLRRRTGTRSLRLALWSLASSLGGSVFYGLALPGSRPLEGIRPGLRGFLIGLLCGLLPLLAVPVLRLRQRRRSQKPQARQVS